MAFYNLKFNTKEDIFVFSNYSSNAPLCQSLKSTVELNLKYLRENDQNIFFCIPLKTKSWNGMSKYESIFIFGLLILGMFVFNIYKPLYNVSPVSFSPKLSSSA